MAAAAGIVAREQIATSVGQAVRSLETEGSNPTQVLQQFNTSFPKPQPTGQSKKEDVPEPELTPRPSPAPEQDQELSGAFNKLFRLTSALTNTECDPATKEQSLQLVNDACTQLGLPKPQETLHAVQDAFNPHASAIGAPRPTPTPLQKDLAQIAADNQLTPSMTMDVIAGIRQSSGGTFTHLSPDKLTEKFTEGAKELHTNAAALQHHGLSPELIEPGLKFMHHHQTNKGTSAKPEDVAQTLTNMPPGNVNDMSQVENEFTQHLSRQNNIAKQLRDKLLRPGPPRPGNNKAKENELEQNQGLSNKQVNQAIEIGTKFLMSPESKGYSPELKPEDVAIALKQAVHEQPTALDQIEQGSKKIEDFIGSHDMRQHRTADIDNRKPTEPNAPPTKRQKTKPPITPFPTKPQFPGQQ